jgi:hypothetical protein
MKIKHINALVMNVTSVDVAPMNKNKGNYSLLNGFTFTLSQAFNYIQHLQALVAKNWE